MKKVCPICYAEQEVRDGGEQCFCIKCGTRIRGIVDDYLYALLDDDRFDSRIVECEDRIVEMKCPTCGEMMTLKDEPLRGQHIRCPHCDGKFSFDESIPQWSRNITISLCARCHTIVEKGAAFCQCCGGKLESEHNHQFAPNSTSGSCVPSSVSDRQEKFQCGPHRACVTCHF